MSERREDLLSAAARRFIAVGIRKTTMEDIAAEAGAGKATLYRYFDNKDAVIDALLAREADRFVAEVSAAVAEHEHAIARIEAAFVAGVRFFIDHPMLTKGRDEEPRELLPRIQATSGPMVLGGLELYADLIAQGIEADELRPVDPRTAAEVIVRLILSYFSFPPMVVRVDDPDELRAFARALVAGALAHPAEPART